jgi:L-iditol 2-dehydrogenase
MTETSTFRPMTHTPSSGTPIPPEMQAVVCAEGGDVRLETLPVPRPTDDELLLRLEFCGLCGTDLHKLDQGGHVGTVLGHEVVGTIVAVGTAVACFEPGQRVVTPHHVACGQCRLCLTGTPTRCPAFQREQLEPGGFAEYVLVRAAAVQLAARIVPEGLRSDAAIFLEPAACVLRGIDRSELEAVTEAGLQPVAVVLGGGSMGLLHVLVLRAVCPDAVIILSEPMNERRQLARQLGATVTIEPAALSETVRAHSGSGADAVFDTVGDPRLLEPALELLRDGGSLLLFAHFRPGPPGAVHERLFRHERRLLGTYSGALDEQQRIFDLLVTERLRPEALVTHTLPLSRFGEAVDLATSHTALKVLLHPD